MRKIFIITIPLPGHTNPISGLAHELCQRSDTECIFYGVSENRQLIEKTGAKYRPYSHRNMADFPLEKFEPKNSTMILAILTEMIQHSYTLLPQLLNDVRNEKPDLIIYDGGLFAAKYLIEAIKKEKLTTKWIEFFPNFVFNDKARKESGMFNPSVIFFLCLLITLFRHLVFCFKFGFPLSNPIKFLLGSGDHEKLVAVIPELQPYRDEMDVSFRFVGPCVSEEARNFEINNEDSELKSLFEMFPYRDSNPNSDNSTSKLILMSLGTVAHANTYIYENVMRALKDFNNKPNRVFKSSQFRVIISVGDISLKRLGEKISKRELDVPENIILRARVPQLELLKRAHLFISHCGMNSVSEAIKYSVPVVAIPVQGDQPIVAKRICDELKLGIRLDTLNLKVDDIADSIDRVLSDEMYATNMRELSEKSKKYRGQREAANIVIDFIDRNCSRKKLQ